MTLATMTYGLIVASLVGAAAWFVDRSLRAHGQPTRWIWLGAVGAGALAPFLPRFLPAAATADGPGPFALPVHALYELGTPAPSLSEPGGSFLAGIGMEGSLGALWMMGSIVVLILFALICFRLRQLRTTWEPRDVCGEKVLRSEKFGPAVVGLIRSRIVLPSWAFGLGKRELDMVVLHEREHVRARDPVLLTAGLLLAALSPWNPAVWWSLARLRLAVEGDCDRRVLARGASARSYARLLLTVAAGCQRTPKPVPALIRGGHSVIERRLMMIRTATKKPRIRASLLTAAAGLGLFALACDTPIPQSPADTERASRVGPETGAGLEAGADYVDNDGIFQTLDPEAQARVRRTLEEAAKTRGELLERMRSGEIAGEKIPENLRLRLDNMTERLGELVAGSDAVATELAMEVRRLHTAVAAGEITHEEAEEMLRTHMGARNVRLHLRDKQR